jgi:hypothetical protein
MKQLIRKILKEETSTSDNDFKMMMRAVISVLKKSYPFIVGWELEDEKKYNIYISLEVDFNKMTEFYGVEQKWKLYDFVSDAIEKKEKYAYPFSLTNYEDVFEEKPYEEYGRILEKFREIYENMPDEYKPIGFHTSVNMYSVKNINLEGFIFVK